MAKKVKDSNAGRPPHYNSAEEMQTKITEYFDTSAKSYDKDGNLVFRPTITGLAYHLGFESRQSFYDYEAREKFSYIVRRARLVVESAREEALYDASCTGSIFALKNMGWSDKQEIDHTTAGEKVGMVLNFVVAKDKDADAYL